MSQVQDTSILAYEKVNLQAREKDVLGIFYEHPYVKDWTNEEIAKQLNWGINHLTGRVLTLRKKGILELSTTRICLVTKNRSKAWRIKEAQQ